MPRKDPDNERRSAAELLVMLLQERVRRRRISDYNHANDRHLKQLCSVLLWKHSEASGKYDGCPFWSEGALDSRSKHGKPVTDRRRYPSDALRHEHLFPRLQLIRKLFSLEEPSMEVVSSLLDKLNIGVVVTVAEDDRLHKEGVDTDPWERYRAAGILWRSVEERHAPLEAA